MAGARLIAWGLVMVAGAIATGVGLSARSAHPTEGTIVYSWGNSLLVLSAVMFVIDYLRSWSKDQG